MSDEQIVPPSTARWKKIGTALLLAIAAACLTLFFFSPRLMLWNGFFLPEVDRAHDTLRQLANPFDLIPNHNSRVNQWRLLFPVLGNVAHLSDWQFLSLPFVGCIATLFYVVRICQRHELSTLESFFVVALAAMSPWYFVSTGWLAYFDSWLILLMLVASFSNNPWSIGAACLLAPWIDERFVIALPIVLLARIVLGIRFSKDAYDLKKSVAVIAGATAVYLVVRAFAFFGGADNVTDVYVQEHLKLIQSVPPKNFLFGAWFGQRLLWGFAGFFLYFCYLKFRPAGFWATVVVVIGMICIALVIAGDMHRSMEMLFPICIVGVLLSKDWLGQRYALVLGCVLVVCVLLPAKHQLWLESYRIASLTEELGRTPMTSDERIQAGVLRASQLAEEGDNVGAELIVKQCVAIDDQLPDIYFFYGTMLIKGGRYRDAADQFKLAMEVGGPAWPGYADCQDAISVLSRRTQ